MAFQICFWVNLIHCHQRPPCQVNILLLCCIQKVVWYSIVPQSFKSWWNVRTLSITIAPEGLWKRFIVLLFMFMFSGWQAFCIKRHASGEWVATWTWCHAWPQKGHSISTILMCGASWSHSERVEHHQSMEKKSKKHQPSCDKKYRSILVG